MTLHVGIQSIVNQKKIKFDKFLVKSRQQASSGYYFSSAHSPRPQPPIFGPGPRPHLLFYGTQPKLLFHSPHVSKLLFHGPHVSKLLFHGPVGRKYLLYCQSFKLLSHDKIRYLTHS